MILDAGAGNRTMWRTKNADDIIYIEIERKIERKPTIFASNIQTPFLDKSFDTIFFDPPHGWGEGHPFFAIPDHATFHKMWPGYGAIPRYYGWDKFKNQQELLVYLWRVQKELHRILKDDGLLWLKWNETLIRLYRILIIFEDWNEMLRLYIKAPTQTAGKAQTYWVCLMKEKRDYVQATLG